MQQIDVSLAEPITEEDLAALVCAAGGEWSPPNVWHENGEGQLEHGQGFAIVVLFSPQELVLLASSPEEDGMQAAHNLLCAIKERWPLAAQVYP